MRLTKSLLLASSLALGTGAAFAGQDSTVWGSVETSPPERLNEQYLNSESSEAMGATELSELERGDAMPR